MNRTFALILFIIAIGLISYNATLLNFENILEGDSIIALIGIFAALCAIVLMLLLLTSKKIQKKINGK